MKQWRYAVYGYIFEGQNPPEAYPQCKAPTSKFEEVKEDGSVVWTTEHQVNTAKDIDGEIKADPHANFEGEYSEVGMYLVISRVAFREGYPETGGYWRRTAFEEADHASRSAEMLGEIMTSSMRKNLEMGVAAKLGAAQDKVDLTTLTKKQNLDAIYDSVHGMARNEAGHDRAFQGLLERYFGEER